MSIDRKKDEIEFDEVTEEEFEEAVKDVLMVKPKERKLLEQRMPTQKELKKKWKLKKKK